MQSYTYEAKDPKTGEKIKTTISADTEKSAIKMIRNQGLVLLKISATRKSSFKVSERVKTKEKILFSRQLSTLINAGLPLVQSLRSISDQTKGKNMHAVIEKLISDIEGGSSFASALQKHPKVFNQIFTSLVAAGEASGTLDSALERVANQQEKDADIVSKVRGAMIYPAVVLVVMIAVVTFMLISVLPQVEELYKGLPGVKLPFVTTLLLSVSHFAVRFWWIILILIVVALMATFRWARTPAGKIVTDGLKLRTPVIRNLFAKLYMARFARTSTTLIASGVPLLQVLEITARAVDNHQIGQSIIAASEKVKGGKSLSSALENDPNFLELVPNMLRIGEQSGAIETMMAKTADYYEKEVDNEIKAISTIIEPVMMITLGGAAFLIVAAVLMPIYSLVGKGLVR